MHTALPANGKGYSRRVEQNYYYYKMTIILQIKKKEREKERNYKLGLQRTKCIILKGRFLSHDFLCLKIR